MYLAIMITSSYSFSLQALLSDVLVAFLSCSLVACRIKLPSISNQSIISEFWHSCSSIWNKNALLFMFVISFQDQISKNGLWRHHNEIVWCGCGQLQSVIIYLVFIVESTYIHTPLWPVCKCKLIFRVTIVEAHRISYSLVADLKSFRQAFPGVVTDLMELTVLEHLDSLQSPASYLQTDDLLNIHIRCDIRDGLCSLRVEKSWYNM